MMKQSMKITCLIDE